MYIGKLLHFLNGDVIVRYLSKNCITVTRIHENMKNAHTSLKHLYKCPKNSNENEQASGLLKTITKVQYISKNAHLH